MYPLVQLLYADKNVNRKKKRMGQISIIKTFYMICFLIKKITNGEGYKERQKREKKQPKNCREIGFCGKKGQMGEGEKEREREREREREMEGWDGRKGETEGKKKE
jgi:hypothetical protein